MTSLQYLVQQTINAVSIGSLYALMAIGLAMVFGILRLINFAHGDLIMVGSYGALLALTFGAPIWAAVRATFHTRMSSMVPSKVPWSFLDSCM